MEVTFSEDNGLTIARYIRNNGVKPTEQNVQAVKDKLKAMYLSNFEQDIIDAINGDEEAN